MKSNIIQPRIHDLSVQWKITYVVAALKRSFHIFVHIMMIKGHKQSIDDDTQCNEQLNERIEDKQRDVLLKLQPQPTAVPYAEEINPFH